MWKPGLEGVVSTETRLSQVDGQAGRLTIAGYPLEELAPNASFEETVYLLWNDRLPDARERRTFRRQLAKRRGVSFLTLKILREAARQGRPVMDALRMAAGTLDLAGPPDAESVIAAVPTIIAAYYRFKEGKSFVAPRQDLAHAANYLYMLEGEIPKPPRARALDTYLNTVIDHGLNASTFTARVIMSTRSDLVSAVVGALGALKGPLHGGAPGPALDMVFEIGTPDRAEAVLRAKLERGERLMGFGHRVYKVRDPRAEVLSQAAHLLGGKLFDLASHVEKTAVRLLEEYKPGRGLQTNVEFYTALLLHDLGLPTELFTPTFAAGRVAGWTAHALEQRNEDRLIRPRARYTGDVDRNWVPVDER